MDSDKVRGRTGGRVGLLPRGLYDLPLLARLYAAAEQADPSGPAAWTRIAPEVMAAPRHLAILTGSFNPPTLAHLALAVAAQKAVALDEIALTISKVTVDKEAVTRATLPDRMLLLSAIVAAGATPQVHVMNTPRSAALVNRGLYVDQASAVRSAVPGLDQLYFVVGFDKIVQICDPRYYTDRDAALDRLFTLAQFLVAPREGHTATEIEDLFARPENHRYRAYVHALPLTPIYADQSSSEVRALAAAGPDLPSYVPMETAVFIAETRPYSPPEIRPDGSTVDRYDRRLHLIRRLLAEGSCLAPDEVRSLYMALVASAEG